MSNEPKTTNHVCTCGDGKCNNDQVEYTAINQLWDAAARYIREHEGVAEIVISACAFKGEDFEVVDDVMLAYGIKEALEVELDSLKEELEEDKNELVDWIFWSNEQIGENEEECSTKVTEGELDDTSGKTI